MNKNQLLALASATAAFSAFITSLANEGEATIQQPTPDPDVPATPKKPRGRPPGTATPAPTEPSAAPSEPATTAAPIEPVNLSGKTIDDMRALIEPLIKGSWNGKPQAEWQPRGSEVKPIIAKYAPTLIQMDAKDYPAFEKDIEALLY